MIDHYQTLGADRGASQEEIKQAWRRASKQHHPDREGGDPEEMARVNAAYECLGDPERRAEYDSTGKDMKPGSLEQEAREALLQLFKLTLDGGHENVMQHVHELLGRNKAMHRAKMEGEADQRMRYAKRTGKVRVRSGMNLYQLLIDQKLAALDSSIDKAARVIEVLDKAGEMLANYEQDEVEPAQKSAYSLYFTNFNQFNPGSL